MQSRMLGSMETVNECFFIFSADRCEAAPITRNAVASFGSERRLLTVTCLPGFRFSDGVVSKDYTCNSGGIWQDISACERT